MLTLKKIIVFIKSQKVFIAYAIISAIIIVYDNRISMFINVFCATSQFSNACEPA